MGFWGRKIKIVLEMILEIFLQCTILLSGSIEYNLFCRCPSGSKMKLTLHIKDLIYYKNVILHIFNHIPMLPLLHLKVSVLYN
jgi:hypothetical protein